MIDAVLRTFSSMDNVSHINITGQTETRFATMSSTLYSTKLRTVGMLSATLIHPRTKDQFDVDFYVADTKMSVFGFDACRRLDIVCIVANPYALGRI